MQSDLVSLSLTIALPACTPSTSLRYYYVQVLYAVDACLSAPPKLRTARTGPQTTVRHREGVRRVRRPPRKLREDLSHMFHCGQYREGKQELGRNTGG